MIKSYLGDLENVYDRVLERLCGEFWKRNEFLKVYQVDWGHVWQSATSVRTCGGDEVS